MAFRKDEAVVVRVLRLFEVKPEEPAEQQVRSSNPLQTATMSDDPSLLLLLTQE